MEATSASGDAKVRASLDSDITIQTAEFDASGQRMKKVVTNSGDFDRTVVFLYNGPKIIETRNGSSAVRQQFVHGTQYIDELVMMRVIDKGDLYVHQGERSERERAAIGKADTEVCARPATCPKQASTMRARGVSFSGDQPKFDNLKVGYDNNSDDDIDDAGDDLVVNESFGSTSVTVYP